MRKHDLKHILIISLVLIVGGIFRLSNLDKPNGLWLDEMITYNTVHAKSLLDIVHYSLTKDMHAPLYYILLNLWIGVFGDADVTLRLFSVIPGILTVLSVYLLGKEVDSRETGALAACFCAISSFLVHYSQEVRLYSLTAFFAVMLVYFAIRIVKLNNGSSKLNMAGFALSSLLLMYTHTIGFVFVFFTAFFFGIHVIRERKEQLKSFVITSSVIFILFIPFISRLFKMGRSANIGFFAQWWCDINFSKIAFSVGDLFSPLILNVYGINLNYVDYLFNMGGINYPYIQYSILPTLIMLIGLVFAIKNKNRYINLILLICAGFLAVFTGAYLKGKIIFITRYIIEVAPLLLLIAAYGLLKIKDRRLSYGLISIHIALTLLCSVVFSVSSFNDKRVSGHKTPIDIINSHKLDKDSKVISVFFDKSYFDKYYPANQGADFNSISLQNVREYLQDGQSLYRNFTRGRFYSAVEPFISGEDTSFFDNRIKNEYITPLTKGKYIVIVTRSRFHCFDDEYLKELTGDDSKYMNTEMPLMLFSRFNESLIALCEKELTLVEKRQKQHWELYFYRKP